MKAVCVLLLVLSGAASAQTGTAGSTASSTASLAVGAEPAVSPEALVKTKHCFVCHDVRDKKIGPSFIEIAHRYHGLSNAKPMLVRIINAGSDTPSLVHYSGLGKMPPENVRVPVSDAEASALADYILNLK